MIIKSLGSKVKKKTPKSYVSSIMNDIKLGADKAWNGCMFLCDALCLIKTKGFTNTKEKELPIRRSSTRDAEHKVDLFYNNREANNYCKFN